MITIGIDPSLSATGIATERDHWTVKYAADETGDRRLGVTYDNVVMACDGAGLAVLEDLPVHAMAAGKTGMSQGVVRLALLNSRVPYITVSAATLKVFATGKGNATKPDIRMSLYQRTGVDVRDDNQADAIWLRYLGLALNDELPFTLPQTHLRALAKINYERTTA